MRISEPMPKEGVIKFTCIWKKSGPADNRPDN
jgi:hypothetical protein